MSVRWAWKPLAFLRGAGKPLQPASRLPILIHAGAGGVGGFAIQLAKQAGLTVITTASASNHEFVQSLGADYAIDYKQEDFVKKTFELTQGKGVHAVLDTVGRENATRSLDTLRFNGHQEMFQLIENGSISTVLDKVVPLEKVPQALIDLSKRHVTGKVVASI
ncbi:zinc-binding dehydrogenase [Pontibacillus sp. ALD_SL1]|uniref:zinc-binding dehydrogenase n=1 Tax=Pontibacillus sp. ALD_SL1 TaxID=2777185 RepID=UPI001A96EF3B|nr:zinc-binding dehydrogenase [Pontibacillus sp. ALD_SL1]QST01291.1 zinc-binding dehydrogenase [Pontibacillus sp. ALD_SL1]